jgi:hypothetical protein
MKKNYLYSLLVATSLTSMMSCAHATDLTQDEDQRPLFTRGEQCHLMTTVVEAREACTTAVARQIGADNARIVVEEERDDLLLVVSAKDHEIEGLHQAADRVRADFQRQIQELNQTCARLAALAMNSENNHRAEVQARQLAERTLLVVQQERDALSVVLVRKDEEIEGLRQAADRIRADFERQIQELNQTVATLAARALETENNRRAEVQARQLAESTLLVVQQERDAQRQARQSADAILLEVRQERDDFARELAQFRVDADLRRQLAQSESARDLEARERRAVEERLAQMEAARLEGQRLEAARVEAVRVEAERVLRLQNQNNGPNYAGMSVQELQVEKENLIVAAQTLVVKRRKVALKSEIDNRLEVNSSLPDSTNKNLCLNQLNTLIQGL